MNKKPWYKKWWVWLIIIFVVGVFGSNMQDDEAKPVTAEAKKTSSTSTTDKKEAVKEEPKELAITEIGTGIQTKNFKVSVESLTKPKSDNMFVNPEEGNEFVSVGLLIENISEKDYTISSMIMFDAYQDGFSINEDITGHALKGSEKTMDGALAAGKKIRGTLVYQVPKDWKELEVNVDLTKLSFSNDGEVKIVLPNK
ncbi:DUF4352 domain-containing protein [Paenibacillus sp. FSL R7-0026]|uniref:DUF4352 domain-containing protein n=1 Tax=Paenibacillus sp. FSL R7-0026 TaxID=2921668 RepID=UPI0030F82EA8